MSSGWFYIPGSHPHQQEYVNLQKLKAMIKEEEEKENYERCAVLIKILQEQELKE